MTHSIDRAILLFHQSRYDLAEEELRKSLSANPNDPHAHALLSLCLARREEFVAATEEAQAAIGLAPDWAYTHFCLARVLQDRNRLSEAEAAAREAVQLDPEDANYWALLSEIFLGKRQWQEALDAAEQGLSHDAEHAACGTLRTMALAKLGRGAEATAAVDDTLSKHPDNAYTHAAKGWALLHQSKPKEALEHFRESLRLDPTLDFARAGMIEALKARNPIYRVMLGYFLFMSRLSSQAQWGIILGLYFGQKLLASLARSMPVVAPWVRPILILYFVFVMLTWFSVPLFNSLLRFSRYGRHTLSKDQRAASNWFVLCMSVAAVGIGAGLTMDNRLLFLLGGWGLTMALPLVSIFNCDIGWPRKMMTLYAAGVAALGLAIIAGKLAEAAWADNLLVPYVLLSFIATPLFANYVTTQTVKR